MHEMMTFGQCFETVQKFRGPTLVFREHS